MKFTLEPHHRNIPDSDLLDDLRRVAQLVGSNTIRGADYDKHGKFSKTTFRNRFGSWESAPGKAGLSRARGWKTPSDELFANIQELWLELG
jgi:hypothetical protein